MKWNNYKRARKDYGSKIGDLRIQSSRWYSSSLVTAGKKWKLSLRKEIPWNKEESLQAETGHLKEDIKVHLLCPSFRGWLEHNLSCKLPSGLLGIMRVKPKFTKTVESTFQYLSALPKYTAVNASWDSSSYCHVKGTPKLSLSKCCSALLGRNFSTIVTRSRGVLHFPLSISDMQKWTSTRTEVTYD